MRVTLIHNSTAGDEGHSARSADPGDGLLDVILIGPSERDALVEYVSGRITEASGQLSAVPSHQGRRIVLRPPESAALHLDDDPWPKVNARSSRPIEIEVDPGALDVIWGTGPEQRDPR